jgi:hypothetical protein
MSSFGGHHAKLASDQLQKKLQEAMATDELQDALAGFNIADDDNHSDVSMEQKISDEIISIASSAATMERQALEQRVVELETQLRRANTQRLQRVPPPLPRSATRRYMTSPWHRPQVSLLSFRLWTLTHSGGCLSGSIGAKFASLRTVTL